MKQTILKLARLCGLFALSRRLTRGQLRILCYHGIWIGDAPHFGDCLFMRPDTFAARLDLLARAGYPVLGLADALEQLEKGSLPDAAVVITIDDAWYGITRHMLPALTERGLPATLYVTTYYALAQRPVLNVLVNFMVARARTLPPIDTLVPDPGPQPDPSQRADYSTALATRVDALDTLALRWDAIRRIADQLGVDLDTIDTGRWFHLMDEDELRAAQAAGIDIQLHTHTHRMHGFNGEKVRTELDKNRHELSRILGVSPSGFSHFCYPSGVHGPEVYPLLKAAGLQSATTTDFGLNPPGSNPFALKRILDCQSMSDLELEARLSGFWSLVQRGRRALAG